ncbi:hypothetical protein B0H16DRAFT_1886404 [Mycena metata]|uniref:Uncharacterized protein n=1 Tax=Mycena metata TaxID=1033252 RepID=A0AAD7J385_9AGAR|nr:hypothetical protein B0H16DRAFT_1886404 [Mycena metata]
MAIPKPRAREAVPIKGLATASRSFFPSTTTTLIIMSTPSSTTTAISLERQTTLPLASDTDSTRDSGDAAQSSALPQTQPQNNRAPFTMEKTLEGPELAPGDDQSGGKATATVQDHTTSTPSVTVQKAQAPEGTETASEIIEAAEEAESTSRPTAAHTFSSADEEDERPGVLYIRWSDKAGHRHVREVESDEDTSEWIASDEEDTSEEEHDGSEPRLKRMRSFSVSISC